METRIDGLFINPSDIFRAVYRGQKVAVKKYSAEKYQDVQAFLREAAIMTYVKCDIVLLQRWGFASFASLLSQSALFQALQVTTREYNYIVLVTSASKCIKGKFLYIHWLCLRGRYISNIVIVRKVFSKKDLSEQFLMVLFLDKLLNNQAFIKLILNFFVQKQKQKQFENLHRADRQLCLPFLFYRNLRHNNIVELLGVSLTGIPFYLVTEFCAKVSVSVPWEKQLLIEKLQVTSIELSATCPQQPKIYRLREFNVF